MHINANDAAKLAPKASGTGATHEEMRLPRDGGEIRRKRRSIEKGAAVGPKATYCARHERKRLLEGRRQHTLLISTRKKKMAVEPETTQKDEMAGEPVGYEPCASVRQSTRRGTVNTQ